MTHLLSLLHQFHKMGLPEYIFSTGGTSKLIDMRQEDTFEPRGRVLGFQRAAITTCWFHRIMEITLHK